MLNEKTIQINPDDVRLVVRKYWNDPINFAKDICRAELDEWQIQFLINCRDHNKVAVTAANSIGKSFAVGLFALWFLVTHANALVALSAITEEQVKSRTLRTCANIINNSLIKTWFDITATKISLITDPTTFITILVANKNNPDSVRGLHAQNFCLIIDEASGITKPIWQALETTATTEGAKFLAIGNPTTLGTEYHKCFTEYRHQWKTMMIDGRFCKYPDKEWQRQTIEREGIDSNYVRMTILGQFPTKSSEQFIPAYILEDCIGIKLDESTYKSFPITLSLDVARSLEGDESVLCIRQGRKFHDFISYRLDDLTKLADVVAEEFKKWNAKTIIVDATGVGGGVYDILVKYHFNTSQVIGIQFGNQRDVKDRNRYSNIRNEMWFLGKEKLKNGYQIDKKFVDILLEETAGIETYFDGKDRQCLMSKDEIRRRGMKSPDYTDALMMSLYIEPMPKMGKDVGDWTDNLPRSDKMTSKFNYKDAWMRF